MNFVEGRGSHPAVAGAGAKSVRSVSVARASGRVTGTFITGALALLLLGCSGSGTGADKTATQSTTEKTTQSTQESETEQTEASAASCEAAASAAVEMVAVAFGGDVADIGEFTLTPTTLPADWLEALPAEVTDPACAMELDWAGDTGTIVAFTVTAGELGEVMDVTKLKAYQDAKVSGGTVQIAPGAEAIGLPIDLSEYPDQERIAPYRLVVLQLVP